MKLTDWIYFGNEKRLSKMIIIMALLGSSSLTYAQHQQVRLSGNNLTLKSAFKQVEQQTKLFVDYNTQDLNDSQTLKSIPQGKNVQEVMDLLLQDSGCQITFKNGHIIISKQKVETGKSKKITGTILDNAGIPVIGANVIQKGTTNGVITDLDGHFSMEIPEGGILQISYIGYNTKEINVTGQNVLNVSLVEDTQALDEVVVIGFGTQKKANLTGAVSTVKMEEVMGDRPVTSVSQALQGSMPGLQVTTTTGKPGKAMSLNIRGTNRIDIDQYGSGDPLVLVDNVPMDINMISPSDIETITVLKDAASAAIYGARAAFGVILITTKRSDKDQKVRINYNNNFAFSTPQSLIKKASPMETVRFYDDMGYKSGRYGMGGQNIESWLGYLTEYETNPDKYPLGYHIDEKGQRYDLKEVNHLERMMDKSGFQQTHNISVDGGTKKSAYRVSFGYLNEDGILVTDKDSYSRYNVSSYLNTEVTSWFSIQADIKYANSTADEPNMSSLRAWNPFRLAQLLPSYYPEGDVEIGGETLPIGTPAWNIQNSPLKTEKKDDIRLFGKATFKPFEGLQINAEYTFNRTNFSLNEYNKKMAYVNAEKAFQKAYTHNGNTLYKLDERHINYNAINLYGSYDKTWGDHQASVMGGFNQEYSYEQKLWGQKLDVVNPDHPSLAGSSGTQTTSDSYDEYALRGLYYRLSYNYKGKYMVETNGRYDGSSKFPKDNRFGFFPSVSAGWRVSEESFMDFSKEYLTNLKIRGSFGQVGNQAIKNYAYLGTMETKDGWLADNNWYIARMAPGLFSSSFTWEKVETLDFGFDMGLFNNRMDVVFDWYRRDTKGMLAPGKELPSVLGTNAPLENSADLRTKGWELAISWRDRIGKDWRYNVGINIYDSRSRITRFDNPTEALVDRNNKGGKTFREGQEIGEIWGFVTDRYYTEDDFSFIDEEKGVYTLKEGVPTIDPFIRDPRPGDILFADLDGNGQIDAKGDDTAKNPGDRKIIGNTSRRFPFSINAGVGWKGFDLSLFFQGVGKRDIIVGTDSPSQFLAWPHTNVDNADAAATVLAHHLDYWTPENRDAYYPRLGNQSGINQGTDGFNRRTQTKYMKNGAYLKLKNITLSYTFPEEWLKKTKVIQSLKVFFSGEDLWTIHHLYDGMDPEQTMNINDLYPFMKKSSFGINVTL
ncbi:MAG: TonB-dependent receptor [Tannerellaceae bacterium]